jgi:hypothetical protein
MAYVLAIGTMSNLKKEIEIDTAVSTLDRYDYNSFAMQDYYGKSSGLV